jgi:hypothetical protein
LLQCARKFCDQRATEIRKATGIAPTNKLVTAAKNLIAVM